MYINYMQILFCLGGTIAHFYGCMVGPKESYGSEIHPLHVAMHAYSYNSYNVATCMCYTWTLVEFSMLLAV